MHSTNDPSAKETVQNQAKDYCSYLPLDLFKSGQMLALKRECQGGLIIQKLFYADFVGPGAVVGGCFDIQCTSVYAIGKVEFDAPATYAERQQAFQKRIAYVEQLKEILLVPSSIERACAIIRQLSLWLGANQVRRIPCELIAQLGGLLPETVALAWQQLSTRNILKIPPKQIAQ
jgi:hypothetical protein